MFTWGFASHTSLASQQAPNQQHQLARSHRQSSSQSSSSSDALDQVNQWEGDRSDKQGHTLEDTDYTSTMSARKGDSGRHRSDGDPRSQSPHPGDFQSQRSDLHASSSMELRGPQRGKYPRQAAAVRPSFRQLVSWRVWAIRAEVYTFIEVPQTSFAKAVSMLVLVVIMLSVVCFVLETHPKLLTADAKEAFWQIEVLCTIVFTSEYVVRLWVCDVFGTTTKWRFIWDKTNMLDLLAILPFYIDLALSSVETDIDGLRVLRSVRLIRLFRVFKLGKYSSGMKLMVATIKGSAQAIVVMVFILCIQVILFSALAYHAEKISCPDVAAMKRTNKDHFEAYVAECEGSSNGWTRNGDFCCTEFNAPAGFDTIFATFWWNIVTVTTVGFGDLYPKTWQGKLVGGMTMLTGILVLSLPTGVIGTKFEEAYQELEEENERHRANASELAEEAARERSDRATRIAEATPAGSEDQPSPPSPPPWLGKPPSPPATDIVGDCLAASSSDPGEGLQGVSSATKTLSAFASSCFSEAGRLRAAASADTDASPRQRNAIAPGPQLLDSLENTKDLHRRLRQVFKEEILPEAMQKRVDHVAQLLAVDYRLELKARKIQADEFAAQERARQSYNRLVMLTVKTPE